jgi:hypothetical protein
MPDGASMWGCTERLAGARGNVPMLKGPGFQEICYVVE